MGKEKQKKDCGFGIVEGDAQEEVCVIPLKTMEEAAAIFDQEEQDESDWMARRLTWLTSWCGRHPVQ